MSLRVCDCSSVCCVGGQTANALTVARVLRGQHVVDVKALLRKAKLDKLGFFHTAGDGLFKVLNTIRQEWIAENAIAGGANQVCFPYVDLTRGDVIAPWTNVEAIGGSSNYAGEGGLDALGDTHEVGRLGKALTSLTAKRRFFRTFGQWLAAFGRFACAAVTVGLLRWDLVWIHIFLILRLIDDERSWGEQACGPQGSTYLAIYYDELHRQNVAGRADRGDEALSLDRVFRKID